MLIVLDESLPVALAADPSHQNSAAIALDAIADSARQGNHVISGAIAVFDSLIGFQNILGARTIEILRRSRSKSVLRGELFRHVDWYVRLVDQSQSAAIVKLHIKQEEIRLPAGLIASTTSLAAPAKFIAENANDAVFYARLLAAYTKTSSTFKQKFPNLKIRYQNAPGGGSTTADLYALEKQQKTSFCLAVVDSDQRFPMGDFGATAKRVLTLDATPSAPSWNCRKHVVDARTVENIFPKSTLLKCAERIDPQVSEHAKHVIDHHFSAPHWKYIPLKKGIKCFDANKNDGSGQYWRDTLNIPSCPVHDGNCQRREECITYVIPPISDKLLFEACSVDFSVEIDQHHDANLLAGVEALSISIISTFCGDDAMIGE
ncbi:MAG: hypothetical protein EON54_03925 [Alcaligenaceae bacterium]|nr:MAG: hypothetical protein EON54_03925 [Alcaligenaceae bacterium]